MAIKLLSHTSAIAATPKPSIHERRLMDEFMTSQANAVLVKWIKSLALERLNSAPSTNCHMFNSLTPSQKLDELLSSMDDPHPSEPHISSPGTKGSLFYTHHTPPVYSDSALPSLGVQVTSNSIFDLRNNLETKVFNGTELCIGLRIHVRPDKLTDPYMILVLAYQLGIDTKAPFAVFSRAHMDEVAFGRRDLKPPTIDVFGSEIDNNPPRVKSIPVRLGAMFDTLDEGFGREFKRYMTSWIVHIDLEDLRQRLLEPLKEESDWEFIAM